MKTSTIALTPATPAAAPKAPSCASCGTALVGTYCHACGEKRLHRHDYAFKHFLEHAVDTVTHFDLRVLRDLWWQARQPGFLANEWLHGRRVAHAPPVQLFLITNLLFYLIASVAQFSPFETKLHYHIDENNLYGGLANRLVLEHLQRTGITFEAFAQRFDALAHGYSKTLVFLFIPLLAAQLWLLFYRQRRYFVEWLTLSVFLFSGMLLLFTTVAVVSLSTRLVMPAPIFVADTIVTNIMVVLTTTYLAFFFKRAFPNQSVSLRWFKALLFVLAFTFVFIPYRFVLFMVCYSMAT